MTTAGAARGVPARGGRARRAHLVGGRGRAGADGRRRPTSASCGAAAARHPVRRRQARGRGRGAADRGARAAGRRRVPGLRAGRGRHGRSSTEIVRRFMLRRIPAYVEGAINVVDVAGRRGAGCCSPTSAACPASATSSATATTPGTACSPTSRGCRGSSRRRCGCRCRPRSRWRRRSARAPGPTPITPVEVRSAAHWWTYRSTKARRELGWTTRPHEETVEATVNWYREREAGRLRAHGHAAAARAGARRGSRCGGLGELVP